MLDENFLLQYGAQIRHHSKGKIIFFEGDIAEYFFMIIEGKVKMINTNEEGKDFIQGIFYNGQTFGEPPLFTDDQTYPATAVADSDIVIARLEKIRFFEMLKHNVEVHLQITKILSERLRFKAMVNKEISGHVPDHRLNTLFNHLKAAHKTGHAFEINLTRQELANLTGLRVETVIRAVKKLEHEGKLKIVNHKIVIQ